MGPDLFDFFCFIAYMIFLSIKNIYIWCCRDSVIVDTHRQNQTSQGVTRLYAAYTAFWCHHHRRAFCSEYKCLSHDLSSHTTGLRRAIAQPQPLPLKAWKMWHACMVEIGVNWYTLAHSPPSPQAIISPEMPWILFSCPAAANDNWTNGPCCVGCRWGRKQSKPQRIRWWRETCPPHL